MEMEITIPSYVAVMTLPNVAFFPHAVLPLHIFEPRYKEMLSDSLATHRLFAVAGLNREAPQYEAPHPIATVGIVRACQDAENETSNLLLQGLARVRVCDIVQETPYRIIRIEPLVSTPGDDQEHNQQLTSDMKSLFAAKKRLGGRVPKEILNFLKTVDDPESFVDLAAFNLCEDPILKQRLLETLNVTQRLQLFEGKLRREVQALRLKKQLQGKLDDEAIGGN